jgi:hypothetical protein
MTTRGKAFNCISYEKLSQIVVDDLYQRGWTRGIMWQSPRSSKMSRKKF